MVLLATLYRDALKTISEDNTKCPRANWVPFPKEHIPKVSTNMASNHACASSAMAKEQM